MCHKNNIQANKKSKIASIEAKLIVDVYKNNKKIDSLKLDNLLLYYDIK
jgi:hypothetical protein